MLAILLFQSAVAGSVPASDSKNHAIRDGVAKEQPNVIAASSQNDLMKTNVLENPSFEKVDSNGVPRDYYVSGSGYQNYNRASQDRVYAGSYSGYYEGAGSSAGAAYPYLYRYFTGDVRLSEALTLDYYYYIESPGNLDQNANTEVWFETRNSSNYYIYFHYMLNYGSFGSLNYTGSTYYLKNSSVGVWNHFSRNITEDAYKARSYLVFDTTRRITSLWFESASQMNAHDFVKTVIDEVSLQNGTSHEYLTNGDFETGTGSGWVGGKSSPAEIGTSTDSTDGIRSASMSVAADSNETTGYVSLYKYISQVYTRKFPTYVHSVVFEFDWKYNDVTNGGTQYAYFYVRFVNNTMQKTLRVMLGSNNNEMTFSNSSSNLYLLDQNFGARNEWNRVSMDMYQKITQLGWTNFSIREYGFYVNKGDQHNASVQLLVDDFNMRADSFGDPGFEATFFDSPSQPIGTWSRISGPLNQISRSNDAHSGLLAANITSVDNQYMAIRRRDFVRLHSEYYFDFSWKIPKMSDTLTGNSYALIDIYLGGGFDIQYILAKAPGMSLANDTDTAIYYLNDLNTTGTWFTEHRNITNDLNATFGIHEWNITDIDLVVTTDPGNNITLLFDDIGFVEDVPPEIQSISLQPTQPVYYTSTNVSIEASDELAGVKRVSLYYRTTGSWIQMEADDGSSYLATIPILPYGTTVQYYVEVEDWCGNVAVDDNGGSYYSYIVGDDVTPTVNIGYPTPGSTIVGGTLINASADDAGSGIDHVEFLIDGTSFYNDSSAPFEFSWNSRTVGNGTKTITVRAHDVAGLTAEDSIVVDIENDVSPPELTDAVVAPENPVYGQDVTITLSASDASGVKNVTLYYRVAGGAWTAMAMTKEGPIFTATIPGQSYGVTVEYYITAFDVFDAVSSIGTQLDPRSYSVGDNTPPSLTVMGPSVKEPVRDVVTFSLAGYDEGSGVDRVEFRVDGVLIATTSNDEITWNTVDFTNGNHTLTFTAFDNAGNSVEIIMKYQVYNPAGVGAIAEMLQSAMSQYGFFIGAGVVIIAFVIIKLIAKRRGSN